ncbi:MAG: DNA (cytosine-5-)-methyltransferase [Candidatus Dormibacteraceae bacterium]
MTPANARPLRFVDLFAGLGGFHLAMSSLGHECVFASEIDDELRALYLRNFSDVAPCALVGDIREHRKEVPEHDVLCAGFPCQPFSKSGSQNGHEDTRGTLFHDILQIAKKHKPEYILLENVGNFEQHDQGRTWAIAKSSLESLGYAVVATEHVKSGGRGLLSPHHLGFPQSRDRFYAVARRGPLSKDVLPEPARTQITSLEPVLQDNRELDKASRSASQLSKLQKQCIDHWNILVKALPKSVEPPWFPLWTDEFGATYPYQRTTPFSCSKETLVRATAGLGGARAMSRRKLLDLLPSHAQDATKRFPNWKQKFIWLNREWYQANQRYVPRGWLEQLREDFPTSLRKLEWNCKGETRDLWEHVLQFRPSGLRVKRMSSIPALVSLTTTQIPIIGPRRRFITQVEALRLQGFPDDHSLPAAREAAFRALGNAVHVGVVTEIATRLLSHHSVATKSAAPPAAIAASAQ